MDLAERLSRAQCLSRSGVTPSKARAPSNTLEPSQKAWVRAPDDRGVALEPFAVEKGEGLRPGGHGFLDPLGGKWAGGSVRRQFAVPQLSWPELAESARHAGFGGIDLTVRAGGHVQPERVATDLPEAVAAIRSAGLEVPMITTELLAADDPVAEPILTAMRSSIELEPRLLSLQVHQRPG